MREIKYRGKRLENGEWVYGSLVSIHDTAIIVEDCDFSWSPDTDITAFWFDKKENEVDPATVGQYTGLKDKNGKEIYEGDILQDGMGYQCKISYSEATLYGDFGKGFEPQYFSEGLHKACIVVGTIHDYPELLK